MKCTFDYFLISVDFLRVGVTGAYSFYQPRHKNKTNRALFLYKNIVGVFGNLSTHAPGKEQ